MLHWVMVAFVVLPIGLQETGSAPPPPPEPLHWLMVAGELSATPVMLFVILTVQVTRSTTAVAGAVALIDGCDEIA